MESDSVSGGADEPPSIPSDRFVRLIELSPSAKLIYHVLENADEPLTQQELMEETLLPARTTRYAIAKLDEANLINDYPVIMDARKRAYTARTVERPE